MKEPHADGHFDDLSVKQQIDAIYVEIVPVGTKTQK